jgi:outer membrane protein OmpA-like peptidoglycan-associated protein
MSTRITVTAAACVAATFVISAATARAQTIYFGGEAGWSVLENQSASGTGFPANRSRFDDGFAAGARIGYELGPWRFEEEYVYRNNGLGSFSAAGVTIPGVGGSRQAHAIMTNVLYDIDLSRFGLQLPVSITPHIGAGIGAVNLIDRAGGPGVGRFFDDSDWQLGYQAIGGIRYNVNPNLAFDLDYRYFATTQATFKIPGTTNTYKTGYNAHNLMASLVYRFGPPPAPPPVAAPPAPPAPPAVQRRVFLVFFDWDKATVTAEGLRIIQQAAEAYRSGAPVQIQVTGYADRSGSPGYNQRLSERRANAVAGALARLGVPRSDMMVSGRGENDNRVPTADGVREPQNRRVEIVFP